MFRLNWPWNITNPFHTENGVVITVSIAQQPNISVPIVRSCTSLLFLRPLAARVHICLRFTGPVKHGFQFPCSGVFTQELEWWTNAFRLNPWAKACADRDYYLFVMVDVISCRYRMEGPWFIALSAATSRTCAVACRMNTALSGLSIFHHPPLPPPHLPFHARIHKQPFIVFDTCFSVLVLVHIAVSVCISICVCYIFAFFISSNWINAHKICRLSQRHIS